MINGLLNVKYVSTKKCKIIKTAKKIKLHFFEYFPPKKNEKESDKIN